MQGMLVLAFFCLLGLRVDLSTLFFYMKNFHIYNNIFIWIKLEFYNKLYFLKFFALYFVFVLVIFDKMLIIICITEKLCPFLEYE